MLVLPQGIALASELDFRHDAPEEILLAQRALADSAPSMAAAQAPPTHVSDAESPLEGGAPGAKKSTGAAFLMNLAVPGSGHLYAGYKRGWVYLGLEAVAWASYLYYKDLGNQRESEFENYADAHWTYGKWYADCPQCEGSPEDSLIQYFQQNNEQQYYEDIGKISTYFPGWDSDENRNYYRGVRAHYNNYEDNAHLAVTGAFVNRIVSAVDVLVSMRHRGASVGPNTRVKLSVHAKPFASDNAFGLRVIHRL